MSEWQPPTPEDSYGPKDERAPVLRYLVSAILIAAIIIGAVWLIGKVIVPSEFPGQKPPQTAEKIEDEKPAPIKKSSDEQAWIKALEKDTLEGYREYLTLFPDGKFKDDAQAEIDAYDNKAWSVAEQRNTISGYEDYLESWLEGLHASKARERIAEMKARAEAIAKDAAERAAADTQDWETAARENTVDSYGRYLTKHPAGKFVSEAQTRIDRLRASAADSAAWEQAKAANRADSYQQYLTSFPQGAYVPQAMAALEQLKPAVGRAFQDCQACPSMMTLPTGTASLGAADGESGARPSEMPKRPVTLSKMFAMSVTEVTFAQWDACVTAGGCQTRPSDNGWGRGRRPVINVSWSDAQSYASWLSSTTGFSYAIPSEAQWEYAARAGDTKALPAAAGLCAIANGAGKESGLKWANSACSDPASDRTLPAGMLSKNAYGLKDMLGNVAEWTQDCNTLNLRDAPTNGEADERGSCGQRAVRGGSWFSGPDDLRYAARLMQRRGDSNDFTGFRVVRKIGD